jgi:uncharacterized membrane protein YbhN (UPF0104 family)
MKKILITIFQVSVTVGVLYWVYHDPNRRAQMVEALRHAEYRWVLMSMLAYFVVEAAAAFRWNVLLKVQNIHLSVPRLTGLFFIGLFYNQFLPGGTGGDIIKSYYLLKETPDKKAGALLAVVFDRFIGLVALVAVTAALIASRYDFLSQKPETRNLLWLLLILLSASVAFLVATYALGVRVPLIDFFAIMPVERTISALPISFAGIGLREKVLQIMLNGLCGVPEAKAILIGSLSFVIILVCCIPGAVIYLFYKPSGAAEHVKLREMEKEVVTLEHELGETE